MKRLCVIPAREGSKRVPRKNIRDFCGRPMIAHAIEAAQQAGIFDTIHVSTDSADIAAVAAALGARPDFERPAALADDHTPMMDVIKHAVSEHETRDRVHDTVCLVYATSPLVDPADLKKACREFETGDRDKALLAVTPFPVPIERTFTMADGNNTLVPRNEKSFSKRTQDLDMGYYDAGMFCFYSPAYIKAREGAGDFTRFRGYVVPPWRVTDIDWPEDWDRAEMMFRAYQAHGDR
jgi:N-acylneuraminate cytidylyltransferase